MRAVKHRTWKNYSGCLINENYTLYPNENTNLHLDRALYLISLVEVGGKFGLVQSYDGAAMSAGLEQKIAVLPKSLSQGTLWGMLLEIKTAIKESDCPPLKKLIKALSDVDWFLDNAGILRHKNSGAEVTGSEIRNQFTPPDGKTPSSGPEWEQAARWATLFNELFNHPATFDIQISSAKKSLLLTNKASEYTAYKAVTGVENPSILVVDKNITKEQDLAMCLYHSHSVNGPVPAKDCLKNSRPDGSRAWAKRLIRLLGTKKFGAWADTTDGSNRYDRTRILAKNSGLWDESLFVGPDAIMPENL